MVCIASLFISCSIILSFKFKNSTFLFLWSGKPMIFEKKSQNVFRGTGYRFKSNSLQWNTAFFFINSILFIYVSVKRFFFWCVGGFFFWGGVSFYVCVCIFYLLIFIHYCHFFKFIIIITNYYNIIIVNRWLLLLLTNYCKFLI